MEAGKSDEVGKVGEEIVGPVDLPCPKSDVGTRALSAVFLLGSWCFIPSLARFFVQHFGWTRRDAGLLASVSALTCAGILSYFVIWFYNHRNPILVIERRGQTKVSTERQIEVWITATLTERAIRFFFCVLMFLIFAREAVNTSMWAERLASGAYLLIFAGWALRSGCDWRHPLLVLRRSGAIIRGRQISWERVKSVKCERHINLYAGFMVVRLTFLDEKLHKIANVALPSSQRYPLNEKELFEFIASGLGHSR